MSEGPAAVHHESPVAPGRHQEVVHPNVTDAVVSAKREDRDIHGLGWGVHGRFVGFVAEMTLALASVRSYRCTAWR
jgi:hypothetical protein